MEGTIKAIKGVAAVEEQMAIEAAVDVAVVVAVAVVEVAAEEPITTITTIN